MAVTKKATKGPSKRKLAFDAKRAERLEAEGVRADTINPALVNVGFHGVGGASCVLCDHPIEWLYVLHLGLIDGRTVTFEPVGSTCIQTWVTSLPHSEAQQAILARLKVAEEEAEIIKASFRAFNKQVADEQLSGDDRDALVRFLGAPPRVRNNEFLADVARKVERFGGWASETQRTSWLGALNRELRNAKLPPLKSLPPSQGSLSQDDEKLLERAKAALENPALATLSSDKRESLQDIYNKVTQYQAFRSDAQRSFLADLVRRVESGRVKTTGVVTAESRRPAKPPAPPLPKHEYEGTDLPF